MIRRLVRVAVAGAIGAAVGAALLAGVYAVNPAFDLNMNTDLSSVATGFYPPEHDGTHAFAWTHERAEVSLPGLDRRVAWTCAVRMRGARPDAGPAQPDVDIAVDGRRVSTLRATNTYAEMSFEAPARPAQPGLTLSITSSSVMIPGPSDRRPLGVQVDRVACAPAAGGVRLPAGLTAAALGGGLFAAALLAMGLPIAVVWCGTLLIATAQAVVFTHGIALFGTFVTTAATLAVWIPPIVVVVAWALERIAGRPLAAAARFVIAFSGVALYLKLIALVQPSKPLVDALFHAHRFEWVLAGRLYFTQLSTSATPFPYAIGLYLFAAPWSWVTHDYVTLLRVVVCTAEVTAGALLYPMVVRMWGDRTAGAVAAALVSLLPLSYGVVGSANLANVFGQCVGLTTMAVIVLWAEAPRQVGRVAALVAVMTLALISHISTLVLLSATLGLTWVLFRWRGPRELRPVANTIMLASIVAAVLAIAIYWGHFGDVYKTQLVRLRAAASASSSPDASIGTAAGAETPRTAGRPKPPPETLPVSGRLADGAAQTRDNFGWPILLLAVIGIAGRWGAGWRDRLSLVVIAWGAVWLSFMAATILGPANARYQQDASEFVGRLEHAVSPACLILAGAGASWAWGRGRYWRAAGLLVVAGAALAGVRVWLGWLY